MRCLVCGEEQCVCRGTAPQTTAPVDIPERSANVAKGPLVKVRTGPSSYLKMTEQEAAEYRKAVGEWSGDNRVDLQVEQANQDNAAHDADAKPSAKKGKA